MEQKFELFMPSSDFLRTSFSQSDQQRHHQLQNKTARFSQQVKEALQGALLRYEVHCRVPISEDLIEAAQEYVKTVDPRCRCVFEWDDTSATNAFFPPPVILTGTTTNGAGCFPNVTVPGPTPRRVTYLHIYFLALLMN